MLVDISGTQSMDCNQQSLLQCFKARTCLDWRIAPFMFCMFWFYLVFPCRNHWISMAFPAQSLGRFPSAAPHSRRSSSNSPFRATSPPSAKRWRGWTRRVGLKVWVPTKCQEKPWSIYVNLIHNLRNLKIFWLVSKFPDLQQKIKDIKVLKYLSKGDTWISQPNFSSATSHHVWLNTSLISCVI